MIKKDKKQISYMVLTKELSDASGDMRKEKMDLTKICIWPEQLAIHSYANPATGNEDLYMA